MTKFEVEFERNNVTPAQFLAYVRRMVDKKGGRYLRSDLDLAYFKAGKDLNFDTTHDGITEKSISKPYEMQTYIRYHESGCLYNEICEFTFDDDKTGHGYYYLVNISNETTETTEETTETTETTEETKQEAKNMDNPLKHVSDIEKLTTLSAFTATLDAIGTPYEVETFKGCYKLLFADLSGYYGYSVIVFNQDEKQLQYCNDYELHYKWFLEDHSRQELKEKYIDKLSNKIFTESELLEPDSDYTSQEVKRYFLHNYYYPNCDYITAFCIVGSKEEKELEEKKENLVYDPLQFCYVSDPEKVKAHIDLYKRMEKAFISDSYEYWFKAFKYEMFNHEYAINWQGDWDVCRCFSKKELPYTEDPERMLSYTDFTETQKRAYRDARSYVLAHSNY